FFERFAERISGQPAWASLPCGLAIISLITAVFGLYWDVSLHIDRGRDEGVFSNPSHFFILAGLYGIFAAGWFSICLSREDRADRPGPTAIRIAHDWYAPLGGVMMCGAGAFALLGFPLDDVWHRLFGQDVTLWGPTHLMLIGGAAMTLIGIAIIQVEVRRAVRMSGMPDREFGWVRHLRHVWLPGGLLVGMSTFQGEFDFGIPQFQLIFHPMLIMLAAGLVLVIARIWLGRGAMFGAVAFFIIMRGGLAVLIHDSLGESLAHFPLYIVEALCVEAAAMFIAVKRRPLAFGATAGALIGTVGLAAEWGWSHVWMPLPWSAEILPETIGLGLAMAISAGLLGAWIAAHLDDDIPYDRSMRPVAVVASLAIFAMLAFPLFTQADTDLRAAVELTQVTGGAERTVEATVSLQPRDAAEGATWLTITSWQGGGRVVVDRLEKVSEGVYRSNRAVPVYGKWKTFVRMHEGNSIIALPIYAPADTAIPLEGVAAPARFERPFYSDKDLLQREAKTQASWVWNTGYAVVLTLALALIALLAWGLHRVAVTNGRQRDTPLPDWAREPAPQPAPSLDGELPEWARRPTADPAGQAGEALPERTEREHEIV
ncbi:MAG TPA: hypothetical protein VNA28_18135, partial [Solirubrobacteraceae bacterium]|nr:hypothetical protein [Solirubrobacteraceae bacterium]